jgi:hypothetical protein
MDLMEITDKAVDYMLPDLSVEAGKSSSKLSDWEKAFITSIVGQWAKHRRLSEKQKEILGKIWDKQ